MERTFISVSQEERNKKINHLIENGFFVTAEQFDIIKNLNLKLKGRNATLEILEDELKDGSTAPVLNMIGIRINFANSSEYESFWIKVREEKKNREKKLNLSTS